MQPFPIPHGSPVTTSFIESVSKWNVDARYVENELRRQVVRLRVSRRPGVPELTGPPPQSSTIDLSLCLGGTSDPIHAQRTIVIKNSEKVRFQ